MSLWPRFILHIILTDADLCCSDAMHSTRVETRSHCLARPWAFMGGQQNKKVSGSAMDGWIPDCKASYELSF